MSSNPTALPVEFDELDRFLESEAMPNQGLTPAGLDGLTAALVLCPDPVPIEHWLPWVWDTEQGAAQPAFADEAEERRLTYLMLAHQARVRSMIESDGFAPRLTSPAPDNGDGIKAAQRWCEGFVLGMTLSPERWDKLLNRHSELVSPMLLLGTPRGRETLAQHDSAAVVAEGISNAVAALHMHFRSQNSGPLRRTEAKVGRNEPCPCGSGKKFKKCCGAGD